MKKILTYWPILVAIASGFSGGYAWMSIQVDQRIEAHDRETEKDAHPAIQTRLKALEDYWQAHLAQHVQMSQRTVKTEESLYELYRNEVGNRAADAEPDKRRKALVAAQAKEKFRQLLKEGESLPEAYRHALEFWPFQR